MNTVLLFLSFFVLVLIYVKIFSYGNWSFTMCLISILAFVPWFVSPYLLFDSLSGGFYFSSSEEPFNVSYSMSSSSSESDIVEIVDAPDSSKSEFIGMRSSSLFSKEVCLDLSKVGLNPRSSLASSVSNFFSSAGGRIVSTSSHMNRWVRRRISGRR